MPIRHFTLILSAVPVVAALVAVTILTRGRAPDMACIVAGLVGAACAALVILGIEVLPMRLRGERFILLTPDRDDLIRHVPVAVVETHEWGTASTLADDIGEHHEHSHGIHLVLWEMADAETYLDTGEVTPAGARRLSDLSLSTRGFRGSKKDEVLPSEGK